MKRPALLLFLLFTLLAGCAVNPVTGEREFNLVGENQEIAIGKEQYHPSIQMQGGPYAVDPDMNSYIREIGNRLAAVSDRELPYEFSVINSSVPNAWALPGGKIAVNRGLLVELENEAELAAVIGHEIVHAAARHGAKQMERGLLIQGGVMLAGLTLKDSEYAGLAVGGAQVAAQLINQKYSRDAESEADYYGIRYMTEAGYDPEAAVTLQEKFVKLAGNRETGWLEGLFASHPPSQQRVEENRITARTFGKDGIMAGERYLQKTAPLRNNAAAYAAYDQGRAALDNGELDRAAELAAKAIGMVPEEGKFYGLQGDILAARQDYQQAIEAYNRGIRQPGDFFHLYLQRGMMQKEMGRMQEAKADLSKSQDLLPTAVASNELGKLALAANDSQKAKELFRQAASSQSPIGQEALKHLVTLDLPDNPQQYIKLRASANNQNVVEAITIINTSPLAVSGIVITARYKEEGDGYVQRQLQYSGMIDSENSVTVDSNLPARDLQLQVTSARASRASTK